MKKIIVLTLILFVLLFFTIWYVLFGQKKPEPSHITSISPTAIPSLVPSTTASITVQQPTANQTVTLPIIITGKARVFENQLNYRIRGVNKEILLEGTVYANSKDVGAFGDFTVTISSLPTQRSQALIIEVFDYSARDGQEIDIVSIPIIFNPENSIPINVFWGNTKYSNESNCSVVYPSERHIRKTQSTARAALEELIKGPMTIEKTQGFYTSINEGVAIQKLSIVKNVARVDFTKKLEEQVGGSCRVAAIRAQITRTLKQFPTITDVIISIDGKVDTILQP